MKPTPANDIQFQQRSISLGTGTLFHPISIDYQDLILDIINDFQGRHGFVKYNDTFDLNRAICEIIDETDAAMNNHRWDAAIAILDGISLAAEDILCCGDDSAGELGNIVEECFNKWHKLCVNELLPTNIKMGLVVELD